ncbi:MAG: diguanylate cyclase [Epsilonproteobacteria bacterium]|nr:diguanylate cyclase [Campylobacterota bacterium]
MDITKAIEIAEDIYWVGYAIPDDPFQCHVYLIKNGDESILIDPGSMITFPVVLEKITSVVKLRDIKYIIMHHQDPDIVGCYSTLEDIMPKRQRYIITHWRTQMLLKHYQWKTPFYLVDKNGWKLKTKNRELEFIFTPYAHFAGAICTYDKKSGVVFSSDLYGALTEKFSLYVEDENEYIEGAKLFHKHYMPTKGVLNYALMKIIKKSPKIIAPQHGSIIPKDKIEHITNALKELECGLYMLDEYETDLVLLNRADEVLRSFFKEMISLSSFDTAIKKLYEYTKEYIPSLKKAEICIEAVLNDTIHCFLVENGEVKAVEKECKNPDVKKKLKVNNKEVGEVCVWLEGGSDKDISFIEILLEKVSTIIAVSLQKELMLKELEEENKELYEKAITDPLTGLYNKAYMLEALKQRLMEVKRHHIKLSVAMIDIDFFKKINDTYGHLIGDCVLKELSNLMKKNFRGSDIIARYGGEEFLIIMPFTDKQNACKKMEEFRKMVEEMKFCKKQKIDVRISVGVDEAKEDDTEISLIQRADEKLYAAKRGGRNRVVC